MQKTLYLSRVRLKNIRCFSDVDISFGPSVWPRNWTVLIGDNGAGKSTLLRAIAIGLGNEQTANALVAELRGSLIRRNLRGNEVARAEIELELTYGGRNSPIYSISTYVERDQSGQEVIHKKVIPEDGFPWDAIFVCGYGVNRSTKGDVIKREAGNTRDNLLTLFRDRSNLFDPEQVLRDLEYKALKNKQQGETAFAACKKHLIKILRLGKNHDIHVSPDGVEVQGPWGQIPLSALGDGYRGTMTWVLDFLGVAVKTERSIEGSSLSGIVLMDEVDEHLHPRWQKEIIPVLRQRFPRVQFLVTTHSPMTLVNTRPGEVYATSCSRAVARVEPMEDLQGKTANEILQGEWFGLNSTLDDESEHLLREYQKQFIAKNLSEIQLEKKRTALRERIGTFVTSPMDELAQEIAAKLRGELERKPAQRQELIEQAAVELRRRLSNRTKGKVS